MVSHRASFSNRESRLFSVHGQESREGQCIDVEATTNAGRPGLDFRGVYAASGRNSSQSGSARSLSSCTTQWSTATAPISNTTQRREDNKNRKRRFLHFTRILMKLLERKDPVVFRGAQSVIHDCEQRKRRGEAESVTDILKSPLKDFVGPHYWREARTHEKENIRHREAHLDMEPLAATEDPPPLGDDDLSILRDSLSDSVLPMKGSKFCYSSHTSIRVDEQKTRKRRLWMIICILMKYLDRTDKDLYHTAKMIVHDCVRRNRNKEEGYQSLSGSIQWSLKDKIGLEYWRRAERHVAKMLIGRVEGDLTQATPSYNTAKKKRTLDGTRVHFEKRPRHFCEI